MKVNSFSVGSTVEMKTTNPLHHSDKPALGHGDNVAASFAEMFNNAFGKVNDLQVDAESLLQQMMYEPGSIDIHTVMIAQQRAEVAMSLARSVRDEAVRSYRELMNLR